ncbi:hypothetical protein HHK36_019078 [Tetracentron sinense]|uniref:M-phase phosphoprotein 6 n=1 Tax=Tetracentron sinense TaxID=13715 RepID=A0A834Z1K7_TETSI|nr:hypothetical protein HHK36_019078 [Tetracentron sinense]
MAKRELSSTLKNLKFMQRAALKEEKPKKEEELKPQESFSSANTHNRKCMGQVSLVTCKAAFTCSIVIMEGNPHPGALKGRMSFQSFNPSIDKLNEEAEDLCEPQASATSSGNQIGRTSDRENGSLQNESERLNIARPDGDSDGDHKRKQPEIVPETEFINKSQKNVEGVQPSTPSSSNGSYKQQRRGKLDWNVLRPPKAPNRGG